MQPLPAAGGGRKFVARMQSGGSLSALLICADDHIEMALGQGLAHALTIAERLAVDIEAAQVQGAVPLLAACAVKLYAFFMPSPRLGNRAFTVLLRKLCPAALQPLPGVGQMNILDGLSLAMAIGLFIYLLVALLRAERS